MKSLNELRTRHTPRPNGIARAGRITAAPSRRVPWVAVAVVLVVGGGLLTGLLVQAAGERTSVLVATQSLSPGQVVEATHLRAVEVATDGAVSVIPASQQATVVGQTVTVAVPKGALVSPDQLSTDGGLLEGEAAVGALLGPGGLPVPNLRAGDTVELVATSDTADVGPDTLGEATVFDTKPATQPDTVFVSLVVPRSRAGDVADVAAQQRLRLVLLAASGGEQS